MDKDTENLNNNSEKIVRNEKGQLPKGAVLNPNGRPKGSNNFETDFDEAVEEIAKENGMTRSEARKLLLKVAFKNAKEGNYSFYKDIHDRIYGQASQKVNVDAEIRTEESLSKEEKEALLELLNERHSN